MTPDKMMPPNIKIILDEVKADIFATFNCVQVGKISKVTSSEQTVEIELQIKRLAADGTSTKYPVLVDCPYFILQGGGAYIDMPIKAGDYCLVLFNDRNIDNWWSTANVADPATARKHSLSDALAVVGLNPKTSPLDMDGTWVRILGTSGAGNEAEAARKGDAIKSTMADDATFWAWLTAAAAVLAGLGVTVPTPTSLTGKITSGSSKVKIG
jgi:hypothetical protein